LRRLLPGRLLLALLLPLLLTMPPGLLLRARAHRRRQKRSLQTGRFDLILI
jgi:hypothetical protein